MKRKIIWAHPGNGYSCSCNTYDIALVDKEAVLDGKENSRFTSHAFIIVESNSLAGSDELMNTVLNRICLNELTGVPVAHVYFVVLMGNGNRVSFPFDALCYRPQFDLEQARKKFPDKVRSSRNRLNKKYEWHNFSIKIGDIDLFLKEDQGILLTHEAIQLLLEACGEDVPDIPKF